jgi:hypothetical protein
MFRLLSGTDLNVYKPRHYTIASTDKMSAKKMNEFEQKVSFDLLGLNIIRRIFNYSCLDFG